MDDTTVFRHLYHINTVDRRFTAYSSSQATGYKCIFARSPSLPHARTIVSDALVGKLSQSLSIPNSDIGSSKPLHYYGVDSLVAFELRNWFDKELLSDVPVFDILGNKSCGEIGLLAAKRSVFESQNGKVTTRNQYRQPCSMTFTSQAYVTVSSCLDLLELS